MWAIAVSTLLLATFVGKVLETYSGGWTHGWIATTLVLILIERAMFRFAIAGCVREGYLAQNVAIVGAGEDCRRLIAKLQGSQDKSIAIRGVFDDRLSRVPLRSAAFDNNVVRVFEFRTMYADRGDTAGAQRTVRNDPRRSGPALAEFR